MCHKEGGAKYLCQKRRIQNTCVTSGERELSSCVRGERVKTPMSQGGGKTQILCPRGGGWGEQLSCGRGGGTDTSGRDHPLSPPSSVSIKTHHVHNGEDVVLDILVLVVAHHVRVHHNQRLRVLLAGDGPLPPPASPPRSAFLLLFLRFERLPLRVTSMPLPTFPLFEDAGDVICNEDDNRDCQITAERAG